MRRVASLYLPYLPIERLRRPERTRARPEPRAPELPVDDDPGACSVPRGGGWRPGARWARQNNEVPLHQQPSMREMGRRSEAAQHPFRTMRADDGASGTGFVPSAPPPTRPPLVLSLWEGQREIIFAACPQAVALGLTAGMPLTQARAYVAGLEVQPADREADQQLLARFAAHALRHWTPSSAVCEPDGLWLDLFGTTHLFGGEPRFCAQVIGFFARLGFTARIAVADSSGAAHALARFGPSDVTVVPPRGTVDAIAPLPIESLRLSPDAVQAARRFGLECVLDLIKMPRAPLARRLGRDTILRLDQALGREVEQIVPDTLFDVPSVFRQLVEPISTPEAIGEVIGTIVGDLAALLLRRGLGARSLQLLFKRVDSNDQRLMLGTSRATRNAAHLTRLFLLKMETIDPGFGIEIVQLTAVRTEPLHAAQMAVALPGEEPPTDLAPLIDQLAGRVGESAIFRAEPVESDVPERAVRRANPLLAPAGWPHWRRPARLLRQPEPLDHVVALLPDHPPRRFRWRGETRVVVAGDRPERIHGEWWVRNGEMWAVRDYYHIEDNRGRRYWLFRRGDGVQSTTGDLSWWLHGVG